MDADLRAFAGALKSGVVEENVHWEKAETPLIDTICEKHLAKFVRTVFFS